MSERQKIRTASNVDLTLIRKLIYFANIPSAELIFELLNFETYSVLVQPETTSIKLVCLS